MTIKASAIYSFNYNYPWWLAVMWSASSFCLLLVYYLRNWIFIKWQIVVLDYLLIFGIGASILLAIQRFYFGFFVVRPWLKLDKPTQLQQLKDPQTMIFLQRVVNDDSWYLGQGFCWTLQHRQNLHFYQQQQKSSRHSLDSQSSFLHNLDRKQDIFLSSKVGHLLILGTTGAGKTRGFEGLIYQAIHKQQATIIIDPKGDLQLKKSVMQQLNKQGRQHLFFDFNPNFSHSNPLDLLNHYSKTSDLAMRLTSVMPATADSQPFKNFAYKSCLIIIDVLLELDKPLILQEIYQQLQAPNLSILGALLSNFCDKFKVNQFNLDGYLELYQIIYQLSQNLVNLQLSIRNLKGELRKLLLALGNFLQKIDPLSYLTEGEQLNQLLQQFNVINDWLNYYLADRDYQHKMLGDFLSILRTLTSGNLQQIFCGVNLTMPSYRPQLLAQPIVVYLGLDALTDASLARNIAKIFLADLAAYLGQNYQYQIPTNHKTINLFIDEAGEVANEVLVQLLNKGRAAGLHIIAATQTIADLDVSVGHDRSRQILGNFNSWLALRTTDFETQQYLSSSLGKAELTIIDKSVSTKGEMWMSNADQGQRTSLRNNEIFDPQYFAKLPNFEYIAHLSSGKIIKGRLPLYSIDEQK